MKIDSTKPRILIIDDNPSIHEDFRKILTVDASSQSLAEAANAFFGDDDDSPEESLQKPLEVDLDSAYQGEEAYRKTIAAMGEGRPYTLAFCDMRMPPGWDGLTTIEHLWKADPDLQVVICSAYSDNTWADISKRLGLSDRLLILKKPFDNAEVMQLAVALIEKRRLIKAASIKQVELEKMVQERTLQLEQRDQALRQKQKLEAIGSLAGGVAHEFNNLLQAIGGYTGFAMEALNPEEQPYEDLTHVLEATSRASAITGQLLSFSRQQPPKKVVCSAQQIIDSAMVLVKPLLSSAIELDVETCSDPGNVSADVNLLSQALLNLCINARDAMEDSGKLSIRLDREIIGWNQSDSRDSIADLKPGEYVVVSVADTGGGMCEEVADRIFEPFFSTKEVGKGTGLGLSMVFGAAQDHGGCVRVTTDEGVGSTFQLYLPTVNATVDTVVAFDEDKPGQPSSGNETILVAEDDPNVREITIRSLTNAGYSVIDAVDGNDAIEKIDMHLDSIQFALIDVIMPFKNGREVAQHLAKVRPDMQILFCSGYDVQSSKTTWDTKSPKLPILSKPIDPATLLNAIRGMLDAQPEEQAV
ncbi:response regulator [Rhodopirellula sp. SWK7]|uniref:response regulator n=1 Tax=Rhodopirellula sp. SWK7 TaxID=595460 RepID=UPI0002C0037B|nr:response regulator [Rhodopirellula sp. SWK7]EMI43140.1 PAS/PAC sensor hybrid histidine kinase [Rhodopirellula sp. SWK7]